jgi:hypothetical protein
VITFSRDPPFVGLKFNPLFGGEVLVTVTRQKIV